MAFVAYILKSESTGKHYYGHTEDLKSRVTSHNSAQNTYTRSRGPWKLIGYFQCSSKTEAIAIERKMKAFKNPHRAYNWVKKNGVVQ